MNIRHIAIFCGFCVALFYAYNFTAAKEVVPEHIGPYGLTWFRVLVTGSIFWILSWLAGPKERVPFKELPLIALAAFCGVGFNMVTFMKGLELTSPISASVLMVTTPIIVLVLSAIFLKEKLYALRIIGILVGFSGAAMLILASSDATENATDPAMGNFLIFVNALSYSFYILLAKKLTAKYHVFTLMKWLYFFGVLFITPFGISQGLDFDFQAASMETLLFVGYVILFATFGTYMLNIIAIKNLRPSVVAVFVYLQPLLAGMIAVGLGKDEINTTKIIAGVLIFAGVFMTSLKRSNNQTIVVDGKA
ncbi:EamA family transporter [Nonlabens spongiae]|uniref:EamA family transporter n=1 Tax=Nonlabens spongiae TaxID=331648 RepID=A0A1W6MKG9_9FLAO|nr:DMT family transporter [Nonlabens spongiae]ARN78062.1 EamA family transporter [Nonlabens spongiae]